MVLVTDELKRKSAEIGADIDDIRRRISALEQQQSALNVVMRLPHVSAWCGGAGTAMVPTGSSGFSKTLTVDAAPFARSIRLSGRSPRQSAAQRWQIEFGAPGWSIVIGISGR
ncbi:hypothetical protein [Rhizobium lentis]|uniref:Uncharacterized protein n=1 Tax=Rhizobium lentis TaxID=1138194 RepID=A0ABS7IBJ0_9HYPH|nr:hypothetical protein [Rhizobium lentis]MBX5041145.1 hypothetical protein [Rhizobium lentis]MBX5088490.1 hypothetical protein [Rhizobium lentis]